MGAESNTSGDEQSELETESSGELEHDQNGQEEPDLEYGSSEAQSDLEPEDEPKATRRKAYHRKGVQSKESDDGLSESQSDLEPEDEPDAERKRKRANPPSKKNLAKKQKSTVAKGNEQVPPHNPFEIDTVQEILEDAITELESHSISVKICVL